MVACRQAVGVHGTKRPPSLPTCRGPRRLQRGSAFELRQTDFFCGRPPNSSPAAAGPVLSSTGAVPGRRPVPRRLRPGRRGLLPHRGDGRSARSTARSSSSSVIGGISRAARISARARSESSQVVSSSWSSFIGHRPAPRAPGAVTTRAGPESKSNCARASGEAETAPCSPRRRGPPPLPPRSSPPGSTRMKTSRSSVSICSSTVARATVSSLRVQAASGRRKGSCCRELGRGGGGVLVVLHDGPLPPLAHVAGGDTHGDPDDQGLRRPHVAH